MPPYTPVVFGILSSAISGIFQIHLQSFLAFPCVVQASLELMTYFLQPSSAGVADNVLPDKSKLRFYCIMRSSEEIFYIPQFITFKTLTVRFNWSFRNFQVWEESFVLWSSDKLSVFCITLPSSPVLQCLLMADYYFQAPQFFHAILIINLSFKK